MLSPDSKGQNQSLKSAIVRVKDPQGAEQSEVTGEDGWVALNAAVGKHECEVSHPQYGKLQQTVELQGGARKLEVVLRPPPAGPAGAPGEVSVLIIVSNSQNAADIAKAQVTLGKTTKKTGADGSASFKVKPGVWPYTVAADGYQKETGEIDVPDTKGPVSQVIFLKSTVERSGDLLVKVLEAGTRKPIPDALIRVAGEQEKTDSHGEARFLRLEFEAQSIAVLATGGYKRYSDTFLHNREYATKFFEVELEPEAKPTGGVTK